MEMDTTHRAAAARLMQTQFEHLCECNDGDGGGSGGSDAHTGISSVNIARNNITTTTPTTKTKSKSTTTTSGSGRAIKYNTGITPNTYSPAVHTSFRGQPLPGLPTRAPSITEVIGGSGSDSGSSSSGSGVRLHLDSSKHTVHTFQVLFQPGSGSGSSSLVSSSSSGSGSNSDGEFDINNAGGSGFEWRTLIVKTPHELIETRVRLRFVDGRIVPKNTVQYTESLPVLKFMFGFNGVIPVDVSVV